MKKLLAFLLCTAPLVAAAQNQSANLASAITGDRLKQHLSVIASAEYEGRETGTAGERKTAAYIEDQFRTLGLQKPPGFNSHQQFYPLHRDSVTEALLSINGMAGENGKDFLIPVNGNNNVRFSANDLVFAGYGIDDPAYNDYANINVRKKVVLIFLGEPKREGKYFLDSSGKPSTWSAQGLNKKLLAATARGAVGVLAINPSMEMFSARMIDGNKKTGLTFSREKDDLKRLNYALLSHGYAKQIFPADFDEALAKAKSSSVFDPRPIDKKTAVRYSFKAERSIVNASNVAGILEGTTKKDEYVFLTAHFDHLGMRDGKIYYGADDDGSGTCAVLNMAEAFTKAAAAGQRPARSIVFLLFSGEEKGLWGSEFYSENPFVPLAKTTVDLNTDMIGRIDTERKSADTLNYVYVVGHDKVSTDLPVINEGVNKAYTNLVLDYKFDDPKDPNRIYFRSDHYHFARKNVPVLFFYDGMLKSDYHKPTDTVDKINFPLYETRARMIFHTAWEMANREGMLKRDLGVPQATR